MLVTKPRAAAFWYFKENPMMIRTMVGAGLTLAAACALAQTPPASPALSFEVASVKPAAPSLDGRIRVSMGGDPGRLNYTNVSLRDLIRVAYKLKDYQISGPDWLSSERYDLVAKVPDGASKDQSYLMLQTLLAERFKLTVHREKKDLPAYALVVAKGGPKLKEFVEVPEDAAGGPNAPGGRGGFDGPGPIKMGSDGMPKLPAGRGGMMFMDGMGRLHAQGVPITNLTDFLSRQLDKPVVDETGLTAKYDISLNWTPEPGEGGAGMRMAMIHAPGEGGAPPAGGAEGKIADATAASAPPLPVALQQQLGLKLEAKKLPLDLLVIDHAEKVPTEN
jgi:uncharacterized protein (TIGR03435 family)